MANIAFLLDAFTHAFDCTYTQLAAAVLQLVVT